MKNNLRLLRKSRGYTQIALQMKTGIEQALLSKYDASAIFVDKDNNVQVYGEVQLEITNKNYTLGAK